MKRSLWILAVLLFAVGCSNAHEETSSRYHVYYLNKEQTKIVEVDYQPKHEDTEELIQEFINIIRADVQSVMYRKLLPDGVRLTDYSYDGDQISLYFSESYATSMSVALEVLCRAAIVRTMVQIPDVDCVSFYLGDMPLTDLYGNVVGLMTGESFVENPGEQINSIQKADIQLYFATPEGDALVKTTEKVSYISNISMEKLIMEHLLEGPEDKNMISAIPSGTKLLSISTTKGTCYVNLNEGFLNHNYNVQEPIVIYSIVDSLSELATVNKVQIAVNGNFTGVYRDSYTFDTLYERNLDYVVSEDQNAPASTQGEGSEMPFE